MVLAILGIVVIALGSLTVDIISASNAKCEPENEAKHKEMKMEIKHKHTASAIHYFVSENNPSEEKGAILFIHPAFADHRAFDEQVSFFSTDYKVITMDLLGHGLSQGFKTKEKIHDTYKHIDEILANENIQKIHLVGVSVGALMAQDFANKYPEKIASLSSLGGYDINNYDSSIEKAQRKEQIGFMLKALFSIKLFSKSNSEISAYTEQAQKQFYRMNMLFKRRSFAYMTSLGRIMNQNKSMPAFPILIIYGEHDNDLAISLSKAWYSNSKGSKLITIKDAGHCANMDNPQGFNQAIMNFLQENTNL